MYEAMMTLTDPQKKCLKDLGFERMIHFPIVELPSALAYHVIDYFHPGSMELRLEKGSIKATRTKVHDMLGIPIGSRKLEDLEERLSNDPFIKDTMRTLDNGDRVSTKLLKRITEDVEISDIDWCSAMKKRIKMETETRCLGKLEHHGEFDPEEQDVMNVYKGLDVYVPQINDKEPETKEEFYENIIEKFHKIMEKRLVLVQTLTNGISKFEHDQRMLDFCKEYKQTFNDAEFNLCESSNDEDSEGDVDGYNDKNNNNDDDGAPTANATKKKERTEESGSKGTEENGSEAIEGGSDGKEENINGEKREVTAQMDVDNQNKELNKEKDANETEDNDKINNNDMRNDSVQEK
ncbi:hypothetical protein Tco_1444553 [Tanacetum coccineum]